MSKIVESSAMVHASVDVVDAQEPLGADNGDAERRRRILQVAIVAFATKGFQAARLDQVARDAQVSTATIYKLFADKDDIFNHAVLQYAQDFTTRSGGAGALGDAHAALVAFARSYAKALADPINRGLYSMLIGEAQRLSPEARGAVSAMRRALDDRLSTLLAAAAGWADPDGEAVRRSAHALLGHLEWRVINDILLGRDAIEDAALDVTASEAVAAALAAVKA